MLSKADLEVLSQPFPPETIGFKVQSVSKNRDKALLVAYLQHTDVSSRLDQVDPAWKFEAVEMQDANGIFFVRARLTVKDVTRENVGEGSSPKGAFSDALKRCATLFGIGRYLYDSDQVWVPYNEQTDRYKSWKYEDFSHYLRKDQAGVALPKKSNGSTPAPLHVQDDLERERDTEELNDELLALEERLAMQEEPPPSPDELNEVFASKVSKVVDENPLHPLKIELRDVVNEAHKIAYQTGKPWPIDAILEWSFKQKGLNLDLVLSWQLTDRERGLYKEAILSIKNYIRKRKEGKK